MKKIKPKGKTPSLIGGKNGRPKCILVERKSECARCKDEISAGVECIAIPQNNGPFSSPKRFCKECFANILLKTSEDLEEIKKL